MSKANSMMRQIERRLAGRRRGPVVIDMSWGDEDGLIEDDDGDRITPAEWQRRHPEGRFIQMTWGDDDPARSDR